MTSTWLRSAATCLTAVGIATAALGSAPARAWDPFVVENRHVERGNERMAADDATGALTHYDDAARELPSEPGVHLNRGLALLEAGQHAEARDAFELATQPPASREIRADAHYDIGLSFYQQADQAANDEDHEAAQRLFRQAADAFRSSLRARPGNADAGWNLELALRRMQEQQEQQEQEEQEQEEQDGEDEEQDQEQDGEDQEQDGEDQEQDGEDQEQDGEDQEQDGEDQEQDGQDEGQEQGGDEERPEEGGDESSDGEDPAEQDPQSEPGDGEPEDREDPMDQEAPADGTQESSLPPEHRRVLDTLQDSEQNFERQRAAARAARENRRVEQDW